jgi:uncharacterized SAM-binding protein YcdF (DUF218 family)
MDFEIIINRLIGTILFPPGVNLVLFIASYFLFKRRRKIALSLFAIAFFSLYLLALPGISNALNSNLQTEQALTQSQVKNYARQQRQDLAIVVISGGRINLAPEYGDIDTVSATSLQRMQYAAWLHRKTNLPILLSGGSVLGEATAEAVLMNQTMLSAFNIAPKWIEIESKNTAQNAQFSATILRQNNIKEILLVTHATHMHRARLEFEKAGLKVMPAPTVFDRNRPSWQHYFPNAEALHASQKALHEKVGRLWYGLRY